MKDGAEGGETGSDDTEGGFDGGPETGVGVGPCLKIVESLLVGVR